MEFPSALVWVGNFAYLYGCGFAYYFLIVRNLNVEEEVVLFVVFALKSCRFQKYLVDIIIWFVIITPIFFVEFYCIVVDFD